MTELRPIFGERRFAVFRADAGPEIGGGHVMRCLTLAHALRTHGWACAFAVNRDALETVPALAQSGFQIVVVRAREGGQTKAAKWLLAALDRPPALVVVDNYALDARYERVFQAQGAQVLAIDDLADRSHACDILLDQTYGRDATAYALLVDAGAQVLLGPRYALLRPAFSRRREAALSARAGRGGQLRRILAAGGATDPGGIGLKALHAVADPGLDVYLDIVVGAACPDLPALRRHADARADISLHVDIDADDYADLLAEADLCIGAGGTSSWERCCLGVPTLAFVIDANQ